MKNSSSNHCAKDPHIVIGTNQSGKYVVRKALYSSPFSPQCTNISPFTKIVSGKFIRKPKSPFKPIHDLSFLTNDTQTENLSIPEGNKNGILLHLKMMEIPYQSFFNMKQTWRTVFSHKVQTYPTIDIHSLLMKMAKQLTGKIQLIPHHPTS